ncbi:MAG: phytochelatin synthase family protein [Lentisphaeraceae bacterium]|nr:phytochelatin synthase family protein [Lentisphaeraceae bacterium]
MLRFLSTLIFICLFTSCSSVSINDISNQALGDHLSPKQTIVLSSPEGQELWGNVNKEKFEQLKKYWEPQRPSYCGVCSAVIVTNTLKNGKKLNQDNFFTPQVEAVIKPATVSKMGMTLRELQTTIASINPQFKVEKYYSHISGLDLFIHQLKNYKSNNDFAIVNFSRRSIAGEGMYSGHFSIVAGYDEKTRMVLILEVNGGKESFWIKDKDLFTAMLAIDPVSKIPRGWLMVQP